jgi:hypothetical protein
MKKSILYIVSLVLLLLTGCKSAPAAKGPAAEPQPTVSVTVQQVPSWTAAPTDLPVVDVTPGPVPEESEAEEERIVGHCVSIADALPYRADLDGDGQAEIVDLTTLPGTDGQPRWTVSVQKGEEVKLSQTDIPDDMPYGLWVGDLDEDGQYELFFHGDLASDDYVIYAWRHDLSLLFFEPDDRFVRWNEQEGESSVFAGAIEGFEDGHIIVVGVVDMLGTHWGVRTLALGEDGIIGPVSTVWTFDEDMDRALTVKRALTAYSARARKDPGEAFVLEPGTRIVPLCSDGQERMWFETDKGKGGVLLLVPDEEDMWLIDGTPEADCFEELPYSG